MPTRTQQNGGGATVDPDPHPAALPCVAPLVWIGGQCVLRAPEIVPPERRTITDAMILSMDPLDAVQLYYELGKWVIPKGAHCPVYVPHPQISAGMTPEQAEITEWDLQHRIYDLRPDLHFVKSAETGENIVGLIDLSLIRRRPPCDFGVVEQVVKWVFAAMLAAVPFTWALLIASLAMSAAQLGSELQQLRRQLEIIKRLRAGLAGLVNEAHLEQMAALGYGSNAPTLEQIKAWQDSERARGAPDWQWKPTPAAWALALSVGLPHPAMICWNSASNRACLPEQQEVALRRMIADLVRAYRLKLIARMERVLLYDERRFKSEWRTANELAPAGMDVQKLFATVGMSPIRFRAPVFHGSMIQNEAGQWIDAARDPSLEPVATWLTLENNPALARPVEIDNRSVPAGDGFLPPIGLRFSPLPVIDKPITQAPAIYQVREDSAAPATAPVLTVTPSGFVQSGASGASAPPAAAPRAGWSIVPAAIVGTLAFLWLYRSVIEPRKGRR